MGMASALPLMSLMTTGCRNACKTSDTHNPNIVIILADDLGYGNIGVHGSIVPTPNIDKIFNQGIELTRHYAAPLSSPTRCGLMTGRYPSRFGVRETVIPPWGDYGLPEEEETLADLLGRNGYENRAIVGKWHMGHMSKIYHPLNRGFTHFYGHYNASIDYFTHYRDGELDWHNGWDSCYDQGYSTDLIAAESARCIKEYAKGDPYLVFCSFNAPHNPYQAPEDELFSLISEEEFHKLDVSDQKGWTYRAMVSRLDKGVGTVLKAIEESGEQDNTIVIFMSDNGGCRGMEPYVNNNPLYGYKLEEFEGGVRVLCAVWWEDGNVKGGIKTDQVTAFVDFVPTLKSIIGDENTPKNPYDGIDISRILTGETAEPDRMVYLGCGAAVYGQWKMILQGKNYRVDIDDDLFVDIVDNPAEVVPSGKPLDMEVMAKMRNFIKRYDAIPPFKVQPDYDFGRDGFVAPHEWKIEH